jgi:hypothetical protein
MSLALEKDSHDKTSDNENLCSSFPLFVRDAHLNRPYSVFCPHYNTKSNRKSPNDHETLKPHQTSRLTI